MKMIFIVIAATMSLVSSAPYGGPDVTNGVFVITDVADGNKLNAFTIDNTKSGSKDQGYGEDAEDCETYPETKDQGYGEDAEDCETYPETNDTKYEDPEAKGQEGDSCDQESEPNNTEPEVPGTETGPSYPEDCGPDESGPYVQEPEGCDQEYEPKTPETEGYKQESAPKDAETGQNVKDCGSGVYDFVVGISKVADKNDVDLFTVKN